MVREGPSPAHEKDELQLVDRVISGTFRLRECIASGSSGAVYRADQIALGRTVAVKILRRDLARDARFVARFHGEALAASRLNHPNTVAIIDYGQTDDGLLYLAMEHLRGETLGRMCRAERPLEPARIVDFMAQIAAGVEEAHEAGVVHADLKPENVVVERRRGGWDLVKVVDFGIARLLGEPRDSGEESVICGTPEYMAPEVIRGGEPMIASDLYALGVILYELCAARPPFMGQSSVEVLTAHLKESPPPLSQLLPQAEIPANLEPIAKRALEKHPDDRFPSSGAFREALLAAAGRTRPDTHTVLCPACGVMNAATFKFCPECGRARGPDPAPRPAFPSPSSAPSEAQKEQRELLPLPHCGRAQTLQRARALAGSAGGALHIAGPAGRGKTCFLRELFAEATRAEPELSVYVATSDPSGLRTPYYPVRALVAALLELPQLCPYDELERAALAHGLSERDLPGLAELLAHRGDLGELESSSRQREMVASSRRVLTAASAKRPTLFVFEDADGYDLASQRVLADVVERAAETPLKIAVTTGGDAEAHADKILACLPVERIDLHPLDAAAVGELTAHVAQRSNVRLPPAPELLQRSGGDPAYLNELVRYALEGGSPDEAPPSVADLIALRLELLPRSALLVAQAIAAYGLEARPADVAAALGERLGSSEREEAVAILEARGLIDGRDFLRFERGLLRDIVYDRTPAETRRALHEACLEELPEAETQPGIIGHHHEGAGRAKDAAPALAQAGDEAAREFDESTAARHYQRALANARRAMLAEDDERHRALFIDISIKLADALAAKRDVRLARGILDEALGHCHHAPLQKAQLLRALGHVHAAGGELVAAAASLRQAIGLGIMSGDRELLALLYLDLASYRVDAGHTSEAIFELTEAIDLITAGEGGNASSAPAPLWRLVLRLAKLHADRGERSRALELGRDAQRQAMRSGSRLGTARAQAVIAAQHEALGEADSAARYRAHAAEGLRVLGDRRGTVELLLSGARLTRRLRRVDSDALADARRLSEEIGWAEGYERAREAGS